MITDILDGLSWMGTLRLFLAIGLIAAIIEANRNYK